MIVPQMRLKSFNAAWMIGIKKIDFYSTKEQDLMEFGMEISCAILALIDMLLQLNTNLTEELIIC